MTPLYPNRTLPAVLFIVGLLLSACMTQLAQPGTTAQSTLPPAATPSSTRSSTAALLYQGPAEMGGPDASRCATLALTVETATVGGCDGVRSEQPMSDRLAMALAHFQETAASFVYENATETLTFTGAGSATDEAIQRAILAWARARHAELASGRTSATISTAISWYVGQDLSQKNICRHLTVLDYGYAQAEEILCEGQDPVSISGAWLTNDELAQLDTWLYERAALYTDNNYVSGTGTQAIDENERVTIGDWATTLWQRVHDDGRILLSGGPSGICPESENGLAMVRDFHRGFCLLVPGEYTVFEISADEIVLAQGSLLNVTDPRLQITVTPANGRDVEAIADETVASFAGFDIARSNDQFGGYPAVVLDNVPGQDLGRRVLMVRNDYLYELSFTPADSAALAAFYGTINSYFTLVDREGAAAAAAGEQATMTLALAWHREGGIAGFCDDLTLYADGAYVVETCRPNQSNPLAAGHLSAEQQATLAGWLAQYHSFTYTQRDPAVADAMTVGVALTGQGSAVATETEQQAIAEFAQTVFMNATRGDTELNDSSAPETISTTDTQAILALTNVNIRSGPGTDYDIVGSVAAGQTALVTGVTPDNSWWRVICPDGSVGDCYVVNDPSLTQPTAAPDGVPNSETGEAIVETVTVTILESFPVQVNALISGQLPDACSFIETATAVRESNTFRIQLTTARQPNQRCAPMATPFEHVVALDVQDLPAGDYEVRVGEQQATFTLAVDNTASP